MVAPVPAQIPNLRPRSPAAPLRRRSLPLLATHYPLSTLFFVSPLFSYSYELLFPQPLYFDNHPHCPGVWGYKPPISLRTLCLRAAACPDLVGVANPLFSGICCLFPVSLRSFSALPPFVFNRLQPLSRKHPGVGYPPSSLQPQTFRDRRSDAPGPHESSPSTFVLRKLEPILYPQSYCPCTPSQLHSSTLQEAFL